MEAAENEKGRREVVIILGLRKGEIPGPGKEATLDMRRRRRMKDWDYDGLQRETLNKERN